MKRTHIAALVTALVFGLWLLSGQIGGDEDDTGPEPSIAESRDALLAEDEDALTRVRARVVPAVDRAAEVVVRGRTEAERTVAVRAETGGRVTELPVDQGDAVVEGDLLCRLETDAREARLKEAQASVKQARIEYDGSRRLADEGYQSESAIAAAEARLEAALAVLEQRRLDLDDTRMRAPFDGFVEERPVELGDFLQPSGICARVVDADPMMLVGQVAERDVGRLRAGATARGRLITGREVEGTVEFVARRADPETRTFRVEVAVPNPGGDIRDGITAEIRLPFDRFAAHRVPSALLALDDAGALGIRILDPDDVVRFVRVDVLEDAPDGIWVRGLPDPARIITVGQELVVPGEEVDPVWEAGGPLAAPGSATRAEETAEEAPAADPDLTGARSVAAAAPATHA